MDPSSFPRVPCRLRQRSDLPSSRRCRRRAVPPRRGHWSHQWHCTGDGGSADWHAPPGGNTHSNTSYRQAHSSAHSPAHGPVHSPAHGSAHSPAHSQPSGSQQHCGLLIQQASHRPAKHSAEAQNTQLPVHRPRPSSTLLSAATLEISEGMIKYYLPLTPGSITLRQPAALAVPDTEECHAAAKPSRAQANISS